jgi:hypothetical protein
VFELGLIIESALCSSEGLGDLDAEAYSRLHVGELCGTRSCPGHGCHCGQGDADGGCGGDCGRLKDAIEVVKPVAIRSDVLMGDCENHRWESGDIFHEAE